MDLAYKLSVYVKHLDARRCPSVVELGLKDVVTPEDIVFLFLAYRKTGKRHITLMKSLQPSRVENFLWAFERVFNADIRIFKVVWRGVDCRDDEAQRRRHKA